MWIRLILLSLILGLTSCQSLGSKKRLRIGSSHSKPFNYWDDSGKPTGFALEVVNRAAQIAGYELVWIKTESSEASFEKDIADLWPFATDYEERHKTMYLTRDWWRVGNILYFPESVPILNVSQLEGKRLAIASPQRRFLPKAARDWKSHIEVFSSPAESLDAMWTGKVDAALIDYRVADGVMVNRPSSCQPMCMGTLFA